MLNVQSKYAFTRIDNAYIKPASKRLFSYAVRRECPDLRNLKVSWPAAQGGYAHILFLEHAAVKTPKHVYLGGFCDSFLAFKNECNHLAKIDHPLVPKIIHLGQIYNFLAMDRMPGVAVADVKHKMNEEQFFRVAQTLVNVKNCLKEQLPAKDYLYGDEHDKFIPSDINNIRRIIKTEKSRLHWGEHRYKSYMQILQACEDIYTSADPSAYHGDLNLGNVLVNEKDYGEVTAVIDFGLTGLYRLPELCNHTALKGKAHDWYISKFNPKEINGKEVDVIGIFNAAKKIRAASWKCYDENGPELAKVDELVNKHHSIIGLN